MVRQKDVRWPSGVCSKAEPHPMDADKLVTIKDRQCG